MLLPTDGVYGLCSSLDEAAVRRLYALKGREQRQPTAVIAASVEALRELVPELDVDRALRGPYTSILANPAGRLPWLAGDRPGTLGVRVPVLHESVRVVLDVVGAVAATSANEPGAPSAASLDEVPDRIRSGCGAELDAGTLSGIASTVVDFTGAAPVVLRSGAGPYPPTS